MRVIIVGSADLSKKDFEDVHFFECGDSKNIELPSIGDHVDIGYSPAARVVNRIFDYKKQTVLVVVDGPVL